MGGGPGLQGKELRMGLLQLTPWPPSPGDRLLGDETWSELKLPVSGTNHGPFP